MGSPGAFIHCGTFGGRLDDASPANAGAAAKPPIMAPPSKALLSLNTCRRDNARFASASPRPVGLVAISSSTPGGDGCCGPYGANGIWPYLPAGLNAPPSRI